MTSGSPGLPAKERPNRPRLTVDALAAVGAGGALGGLCRWLLGDWVPDGAGFPWTTFGINVVGSVLLALLPALIAPRRSHRWALFLGPGVLGGFTTLSAYGEQTRALIADGHAGVAASYYLGTLAACLLAVALAQHVTTPTERAEVLAQEGDE